MSGCEGVGIDGGPSRAAPAGGGRGAGHARSFRAATLLAAAALLVSGCEGLGEHESSAGSGPAAPDGRAVSPLKNPDGTKPGLAPVATDADKAAAGELIGELSTKGRGPRTGYDRDRFGYAWMDTADGVPLARNGCDTRNVM